MAKAETLYTTTLVQHGYFQAERLTVIRAIVDALAPVGGHRFTVKVGSHVREIEDVGFRQLLGEEESLYDAQA